MDEVSVIGVDLAKHVFQLEAMTASGEVVWQKRLKREAFKRFMAEEAPRCLIGFEASGGAHYWGRWLLAQGFQVKMMAPKSVKAYREGVHKNDERDAHAAAEAASRARVRAVRVKSEAAQAVQLLVRWRSLEIKQQGQTGNQLRGMLNEFGFVMPKGRRRLLEAVERLASDAGYLQLPESLRQAVKCLCDQLVEQTARVKQATELLAVAVKDDETCTLLRTAPGIGPINVASLSVVLEAPHAYANARAFAASLRLVPRQSQSADRKKLLGIGAEAANQTRSNLVLAGQSLITKVKRMKQPPQDKFLLWVWRLYPRKHRNVATVAIAAKLARIAWAMASRRECYRPRLASA